MKKKEIVACLLLITWLMTGFAVDDEFPGEFRVFVKYRPAFQYYFKSPLGMDDMPADYPAAKAAAYYTYRDFVLERHWSSGLDWLAVLFTLGMLTYCGHCLLHSASVMGSLSRPQGPS